MQMNRAALSSALDRGASIILEVVVVIVLAMLIPVILVGAVALAIYGDVAKKRNRWTGVETPAEFREISALEVYHLETAPRSSLGRRGFVKRWMGLFGVGVLVGAMSVVIADGFQYPLDLLAVAILELSYAIPAFIFSVKWSAERAEDAGRNGAWGLLILVPVLNILVLIVLSVLPSRSR